MKFKVVLKYHKYNFTHTYTHTHMHASTYPPIHRHIHTLLKLRGNYMFHLFLYYLQTLHFIYRVAATINRIILINNINQFVFGMDSSAFTASQDLNCHIYIYINHAHYHHDVSHPSALARRLRVARQHGCGRTSATKQLAYPPASCAELEHVTLTSPVTTCMQHNTWSS
jgi:hypothetical protein